MRRRNWLTAHAFGAPVPRGTPLANETAGANGRLGRSLRRVRPVVRRSDGQSESESTMFRRQLKQGADAMAATLDESERIAGDLKRYAPDMESLVARLQSLPANARDEVERRMTQMRQSMDDAREAAMERAQQAIETTESYVRREPWKAMVAVAIVGTLLGVVLARSATSDER
jgi:ElaB/YqjD/DUF883 family membrane-anchored ribosome-binding protein